MQTIVPEKIIKSTIKNIYFHPVFPSEFELSASIIDTEPNNLQDSCIIKCLMCKQSSEEKYDKFLASTQ
jgi:hypothetical protein